MQHGEYRSTSQAAALLGLSARTLEGMRLSGDGPPFHKFGGRVCYRREDLDEWAKTRKKRSTSDAGTRDEEDEE